MKTIEEIIIEVLESNGKEINHNLTDSSHLRNDLGMSSFDLAELTVNIEAEYDIDVFENGIVNTVAEIKEIIKN